MTSGPELLELVAIAHRGIHRIALAGHQPSPMSQDTPRREQTGNPQVENAFASALDARCFLNWSPAPYALVSTSTAETIVSLGY